MVPYNGEHRDLNLPVAERQLLVFHHMMEEELCECRIDSTMCSRMRAMQTDCQ